MRLRFLILVLLLHFAGHVSAEQPGHQMGAHVHGHGSLNVAIDGKRVRLELIAPSADIVAFEHKAATTDEKSAISNAKATLSKIGNVVALPKRAMCSLTEADVAVSATEAGKGQEPNSADKRKGADHAEFRAQYELACAAPRSITTLAFPYFTTFPRAKELDVAIIGPRGQRRFDVTRDVNRINIDGIM